MNSSETSLENHSPETSKPGNLDPESEKQVMDLLKQINKDMETTIIVVTHRGSLSSYADHVVTMEKGSILRIK